MLIWRMDSLEAFMVRDKIKIGKAGTSLVVQKLGLRASNAGSTGSIPGWETRILHAVQCSKKKSTRFSFKLIYCYILPSSFTYSVRITNKAEVHLLTSLKAVCFSYYLLLFCVLELVQMLRI